MASLPTIEIGSVKVMRSYDYCHFEVCLSSSSATTPELVDELRKKAARLADKAVEQYKIAKADAERRSHAKYDKQNLAEEVTKILAEVPEKERTPEQMAKVKKLSDEAYWARRYDYEDEWSDYDED